MTISMSQRTLPRLRSSSYRSSPSSNGKSKYASDDEPSKSFRTYSLSRHALSGTQALILALACSVVTTLFVYTFCRGSSGGLLEVPPRKYADTGIRPQVAWLMSFPNSGTSFVMRMVRETTNSATATNYGLEGDIQDEASLPAIPGKEGEDGPWLDTIRGFYPETRDVILTNTHCTGYCSGRCPHETTQNARSFMNGCLEGKQGAYNERGELDTVVKVYHPKLVTKAIHLIRHPLDNIVARFHLEHNSHKKQGVDEFIKLFPKNEMGFRRWCALDHLDANLLTSRFVDARLKKVMENLPCLNEFYKYVQWHNLAFAVGRDMGLDTMSLRYEDLIDEKFPQARDSILKFLGLSMVAEGEPRQSGKDYKYYYTTEQRQAIVAFLEEFATAETWQMIKDYNYDI